MAKDRQYHIDIAPNEIPERVLLPGNPFRAQKIANEFFDNPEEIAHKREYWSFKGTWKGIPVAVCSTGIGCPSAAIALEELVKVGCKTFIRVGTSGAIDSSLKAGNIVIFSGAVRDDGTSKQYVPVEFPAVADPEMVIALTDAAKKRNARYKVGIGHSKDAFYSEYPSMVADSDAMERRWDWLRNSNVLATEMEAAVLFTLGQLRTVRVGSACVIVGEPIEKEKEIEGEPKLDDLVSIALDAAITFR